MLTHQQSHLRIFNYLLFLLCHPMGTSFDIPGNRYWNVIVATCRVYIIIITMNKVYLRKHSINISFRKSAVPPSFSKSCMVNLLLTSASGGCYNSYVYCKKSCVHSTEDCLYTCLYKSPQVQHDVDPTIIPIALCWYLIIHQD